MPDADEAPPVILSRRSSSSLADLYNSQEFSLAWDNQAKHHIASEVLHLRRFRGMSQTAVANAMGTSQSHIARIEAGEENLTLNTLERLIVTLNGRLSVSIQPAELMAQRMSRWWDVQQPIRSATTDWSMVFAVVHRDGERAIVGLMRGSLLGDGNAS